MGCVEYRHPLRFGSIILLSLASSIISTANELDQGLWVPKFTSTFTFPISSPSSSVQSYFDAGALHLAAFNRFEARRCFEAASALDPTCFLCHWGVSLACGPNVGSSAFLDAPCAQRESAAALALLKTGKREATAVQSGLVEATALRFASGAVRGDHATHTSDGDDGDDSDSDLNALGPYLQALTSLRTKLSNRTIGFASITGDEATTTAATTPTPHRQEDAVSVTKAEQAERVMVECLFAEALVLSVPGEGSHRYHEHNTLGFGTGAPHPLVLKALRVLRGIIGPDDGDEEEEEEEEDEHQVLTLPGKRATNNRGGWVGGETPLAEFADTLSALSAIAAPAASTAAETGAAPAGEVQLVGLDPWHPLALHLFLHLTEGRPVRLAGPRAVPAKRRDSAEAASRRSSRRSSSSSSRNRNDATEEGGGKKRGVVLDEGESGGESNSLHGSLKRRGSEKEAREDNERRKEAEVGGGGGGSGEEDDNDDKIELWGPVASERAAERLALVGGGLGHLLHMPSHIYARLGRYRDSVNANVAALRADAEYKAHGARPYLEGHNRRMLVWSAANGGVEAEALAHSEKMGRSAFLAELTRFGRHAAVLNATSSTPSKAPSKARPNSSSPSSGCASDDAICLYSRGMALAAFGRRLEAQKELSRLESPFSLPLHAGIDADTQNSPHHPRQRREGICDCVNVDHGKTKATPTSFPSSPSAPAASSLSSSDRPCSWATAAPCLAYLTLASRLALPEPSPTPRPMPPPPHSPKHHGKEGRESGGRVASNSKRSGKTLQQTADAGAAYRRKRSANKNNATSSTPAPTTPTAPTPTATATTSNRTDSGFGTARRTSSSTASGGGGSGGGSEGGCGGNDKGGEGGGGRGVSRALALLLQAVQVEDGLAYDEPPPWHYPSRQCLGAALLFAGGLCEEQARERATAAARQQQHHQLQQQQQRQHHLQEFSMLAQEEVGQKEEKHKKGPRPQTHKEGGSSSSSSSSSSLQAGLERELLSLASTALGHYESAEAVYLSDLRLWPHNPWSTRGLASAQEALERARSTLEGANNASRATARETARGTLRALVQEEASDLKHSTMPRRAESTAATSPPLSFRTKLPPPFQTTKNQDSSGKQKEQTSSSSQLSSCPAFF